MTIDSMGEADVPEVVALLAAQSMRWHKLDQRLGLPATEHELATMVANNRQAGHTRALVVHDAGGRVRGWAQPALFELAPDSDLLAYFTACNGTVEGIALPTPDEPDSSAAFSALVAGLTQRWQQQDALADMLTWPSKDAWIEPLLVTAGFLPEHILNHRPTSPLSASAQSQEVAVVVRRAAPADEDELIALNRANVAHDASYSAAIRVVPSLEPALRRQLARLWRGEPVEDGVPLILVGEQAGAIVGMAQSYFEVSPGFGVSASLPRGRYAYLHEVIVRPEMRGKGVGRALVHGVMGGFAELKVEAYTLYFTPKNPLSSTFWPHLGFTPVLTTYMRLRGQNT